MFLCGMFVPIPALFKVLLNLSESYPLSARIILGLPTELLTIVGIASGISCLSPDANTMFNGVPKKSVNVDILVPVFLYFPEYPVVSKKLKLGTSDPSIDDIFMFNFFPISNLPSIKFRVFLSPKFFCQNLNLLQ